MGFKRKGRKVTIYSVRDMGIKSDEDIKKAAQYASILAELRDGRDIYEKNIKEIALASCVSEAMLGMATHYKKIIEVYDAAIQNMMQRFNEVMQLDFPELEEEGA